MFEIKNFIFQVIQNRNGKEWEGKGRSTFDDAQKKSEEDQGKPLQGKQVRQAWLQVLGQDLVLRCTRP